ncbi:hypothetical protein CSKR_203847 [Clonorchis sinensis]|uniref:Uncharacterized protein n=1 Tax=Clonorchis sinensis TaxID=79923 RepID=A0A8T1N0N7_CLOSI|nr:hypothetical protein CSKR_203847 [Clonorchis sinensis]
MKTSTDKRDSRVTQKVMVRVIRWIASKAVHCISGQRCRTDTSEFLTVTGLQLNRNTTLTSLDTCTPTGSFVSELFLDETLLSNYPQIYKIGRCAFIFAKMKRDHHLPEDENPPPNKDQCTVLPPTFLIGGDN